MTAESAIASMQFRLEDAQPFLDRLAILYTDMDRSYEETARHYGFVCNGCNDNCCQSLFFHHTIVECIYLIDGFRRLPLLDRQVILEKAAAISGEHLRGTCPLIVDGRCRLYPFRPMICRLHGIPHEIRLPGRPPSHHPGCAAFERCLSAPPDRRLDRTPHYTALARLEQDAREHLRFHSRIRLTVAQILTTFTAWMDRIDRSTDPVDAPGCSKAQEPFDRRHP